MERLKKLTKLMEKVSNIYISEIARRYGKGLLRGLAALLMVGLLAVPGLAMGNEEESLPVGASSVQEEGLSAELIEQVEKCWDGGLFGVPLYSFYEHFKRHRYDRGMDGIRCPSDYFKLAMDLYKDSLVNPENYRISEKPQHGTDEVFRKYTHYQTRFFIIHNGKGTICTCGGLRNGGKHHAKRNARRVAEMIRRQQEEG